MKKITLNLTLLIVGCLNAYTPLRQGIANHGTHFPALATIVANTQGPILEMGCGDYSTPLLHALCAPTQRFLVSTDADPRWVLLFLDYQRSWHRFQFVPAYEQHDGRNTLWYSVGQNAWDAVGNDVHWSIVLVDQSPGLRRVIDIERLRSHTDIFIVHDTQDSGYGYEPLLSSFKYKYVYDRYHITTTIVSDTIDIGLFFEK
jgi:hypothetical protein